MWLRTLACPNTPYVSCPNAPYSNPLLRLLEAFFFIDIFVNFRTPWITETGHVVFNQRTACSRYINGWFMLDVISIVPFDLLFALLEDGNTDSPSEFARWDKVAVAVAAAVAFAFAVVVTVVAMVTVTAALKCDVPRIHARLDPDSIFDPTLTGFRSC